MDPEETLTEKSARLQREAIGAALIARLTVEDDTKQEKAS